CTGALIIQKQGLTTASGLQLAVAPFREITTASLKRTEFDRKQDISLIWKTLDSKVTAGKHRPNVQLGKLAAVTACPDSLWNTAILGSRRDPPCPAFLATTTIRKRIHRLGRDSPAADDSCTGGR